MTLGLTLLSFSFSLLQVYVLCAFHFPFKFVSFFVLTFLTLFSGLVGSVSLPFPRKPTGSIYEAQESIKNQAFARVKGGAPARL